MRSHGRTYLRSGLPRSFPNIPFVITGGVTCGNAVEFIAAGALAVGGRNDPFKGGAGVEGCRRYRESYAEIRRKSVEAWNVTRLSQQHEEAPSR